MKIKFNAITSVLAFVTGAFPFISNAEVITDPQFSNYQTEVSSGPFVKK